MLLEVGRVGRAHGLGGDVVVELVTTLEQRLALGSSLSTDAGRQLTIGSARPLPDRHGARAAHWLVHFAGVDDRVAAEALTGHLLLAEPLAGAEGLWVHELIGSAVEETSGALRGRVVAVEANPASDLLVLDTGALVPLCFVVSSQPGKVVVDVPSGLFEL
jgi:16S rRNA processing protein RimM